MKHLEDWICVALLGLLALAVGLAGAAGVPLDDHEIYVAQTAQNMLDHHHWIVPHLNDAWRLQKPPLSYWATAVTAMLVAGSKVSELAVRLPSIISGVLLVWLVFVVARAERGRATGLLAGLICITSLGFFRYVHSGRADMLYAMLAFAMLAAYLWSTHTTARQRLFAALCIWLAFALDILAKGPQFGAVVLAVALLHAIFTTRDWRLVWQRFRPELGLGLLAVMVLPWWIALHYLVGPQLGNSQLSGSLLSLSPARLLHGFYWWHAPGLWAPWLVLIVPAVYVSWREPAGVAGLLLLTLLAAVIVFTLGPQYRDIYMLPTVPIAAVWLALGACEFCCGAGRSVWLGFALQASVLLLLAVGGLVWIGQHTATHWMLLTAVCIVVAALLIAAGWALWQARRDSVVARWQVLSLLALAVGVALIQAAFIPDIWSATRYYQHQLTQDMAPYRNRPMAVLSPQKPDVFVYYLGRPVHVADNVSALCDWVRQQPENRRPLLLYNPAEAKKVTAVFGPIEFLLQSPGSHQSSVIVAQPGAQSRCMPGAVGSSR
ncbi:MAG: glycosyltransferase family 39 protein [Salinisphaera sp.]|jgi:4-amino-4-deoxy-L-arabinose transferase-like glycosyltransferase|nr:glycosyltransferase family 39 protein [Salinisphaera sp.]